MTFDIGESNNPGRILAIDDDPAILRAIRLSLVLEGFRVETAMNGADGLMLMTGDAFDLIILDLQMPRMDGPGFFAEARRLGYEVPILILSAFGADSAQAELGAQGAIAKPFDPVELVSTVRSLIPAQAREELF